MHLHVAKFKARRRFPGAVYETGSDKSYAPPIDKKKLGNLGESEIAKRVSRFRDESNLPKPRLDEI